MHVILPGACKRTRGRVFGVFVKMCVCVFVCGHEIEHFERNRLAYELYLHCMNQKWKNTYLTNESVLHRKPFFVKLPFNIGNIKTNY